MYAFQARCPELKRRYDGAFFFVVASVSLFDRVVVGGRVARFCCGAPRGSDNILNTSARREEKRERRCKHFDGWFVVVRDVRCSSRPVVDGKKRAFCLCVSELLLPLWCVLLLR